MAQQAPYDPEEGIIDLFEIVDDPVLPPSGPRGELREEASEPEAFEAREPAPEQEGVLRDAPETSLSRYPFENEEGFREEQLKQSSPVRFERPEEAADTPEMGQEDALIRTFEEEMAKAGSGANDVRDAGEERPEAEEAAPEACGGDAFGQTFCAESPESVEPEAEHTECSEGTVSDTKPENSRAVLQNPAPEESGGIEPGAEQNPESGEALPPPAAVEALFMDAPDAKGAELPKEEKNMEAAGGESADEGSPVLNMYEGPRPAAGEQPECPADGVGMVSDAAYPGMSAGVSGGLGGCLAQSLPVENASANPEIPGVEKRIIRLEEALSRLNERVVDLERRVEDAEGEMPVLSSLSGDIQSLLAEGTALCGQLKSLSAEREAELHPTPFAEEPEVAPAAEEPQDVSAPEYAERTASCNIHELQTNAEAPAAGIQEAFLTIADDEPDIFGLALEALEQRVSRLEQYSEHPASAPDTAGIAQDVLALVRVDMEKASEEQDSSARVVSQLQQRVETLEARPLPQLILPELPDAEAITANVMARIQSEVDRIAAEAAARVLREEIASLMQK